MTRQQRRAEERKASKGGNAVVVEQVKSKGFRIKVGGIYLIGKDGQVAFFPTEVAAREALQKIMDQIQDQIRNQMEMMAKRVAAAKEKADGGASEVAQALAEAAITKLKRLPRKKKVDEAAVEAAQPSD